ncbi:MAG: RAD55 family ATPase [Myxococcota bacterium]
MSRDHPASIGRVATGIEGLDQVLNGGIPETSITLMAGEPGSGKTVLALQMLFEAARRGERCIYFTTLSEPALKVIRYMQLFDFFDQDLLEKQIELMDLGTALRSRGAEAALAEVVEKVEEEQPSIVVIDSFKAIHDLVEPVRRRSQVYELAVAMASWGATTLLVGEYGEKDISKLPDFAIADGILRLGWGRRELTMVRELEVRKLRGSSFVLGTHFYEIDEGGISFYPRVRVPAEIPAAPPEPKVTTGTPGLDGLLRGGLPSRSTTLLVGGTGTGKTLLGLQFLVEGARRGEPGILVGLEESPEQIIATAAGFGWDLEALQEAGLLELLYVPPVELSTDRFLHELLTGIGRTKAKRVVLDSLTSLALGAVSERRLRELVYALAKHLRAAGITSMLSMEVPELLGTGQISGHGVSFAADNVIFIRYVETQGRLDRALAVIKARGVGHGRELVGLMIGGKGVEVGGPLSELQGVLTGLPHKASAGETGKQP